MVWGCMGWNGIGKLTEVQGIMDAKQYCEILEDELVESFEELEVEEGERIFQQDNDPNTPQNWQQSVLKTTTSMS
jgi:hypothetical protein